MRRALPALLLLAAAAAASGVEPFALVGDSVISREEYEAAAAAGVRQKFYHARPPEAELASFRREVGERLIERALLVAEAKRRGIVPERAKIDEELGQYERRYASSAHWRANREKLLPPLVEQLERRSVLEQLERAVRAVPAADEKQARAYYAAHKEQFTEPERVRLSIIVLRVDPSSPRAAWEQAREEAGRLHRRLQAGADFAELARMHSADGSAANGGDLGYVHKGMLPEVFHAAVLDKLRPGELSEPLRLLEGFALVRMEDRKPARLRGFEDVSRRAAELAQRSRAEAAWKALVSGLRGREKVRVDESVYQASAAR